MKNKYFQLKNRLDKIVKDFEIKDGSIFKNIVELLYDDDVIPLRKLIKVGNLKIGLDTLIFNMGSAYKCPADKLGLCKVSDKCYAKKAENQYWLNTTHYREKQAKYWKRLVKANKPEYFAADLREIITSKNKTSLHKIKFLRLNESGDFYGQKDIDFLIETCKILAITVPDFIIYTYTARSDLNFSEVLKQPNLVINGSGFMIDNNFDTFNHESQLKKNDKLCKGSCTVCKFCKVKKGYDIKIKLH